ncbi:hypothetical protein OO185_04255 [Prosthecochloris sp. SCSIO W1102]|nr:hypothetical protein [Prosthecochloris sp. SCSIO W1102]UZJ39151.1 hypothetical protein OO185_04255 [Prosthecochloris sp. SCSIO W1102]
MWKLNSSWLEWMDHLESIGGDCEGPNFRQKSGDITVRDGRCLNG